MKLTMLILLSTFVLNSSATQYVELPFEPAYAADQKIISFDSLGGEIGQFQQMSQWHSMLGAIKGKKLERDALKKSYERGKLLLDTDGISRDELERREYRYKLSEGHIEEMENRAQMVRLSVETTKNGMIMQGDDTGKDLRREIAQNMKESLEFQVKALQSNLGNANLTEAFQRKQADIAKDLYAKKAISLVEYENRIMEYDNSKIQLEVLAHQIETIGKAVEGLNKSLERLFGTP